MQFQSSSILNFPITEIRFPQRDSAGVATQNNELRFRLQAMEQQAQLRDGAYLSSTSSHPCRALLVNVRPIDPPMCFALDSPYRIAVLES
jgi:hypothetical protein